MNIMVIAPLRNGNKLNEYTCLITDVIKIMVKSGTKLTAINRQLLHAYITSSYRVDDAILYEALSYMGYHH